LYKKGVVIKVGKNTAVEEGGGGKKPKSRLKKGSKKTLKS